MPIINFLNPVRDNHKVSAYSRKILEDIMKASGLMQITITSTARTAHDQARIMFENIEKHGTDHQKKTLWDIWRQNHRPLFNIEVRWQFEGCHNFPNGF